MRILKYKFITLAIYSFPLMLFSSLHASSSEKEFWYINSENLRCLINNIDVYGEGEDDPIIIFIESCPETDISKIFKKRVQNSGELKIRKKQDSIDNPAAVLYFTRRQLACLKEIKIEKHAEVIKFPKNPCN